MDIEVRLFATFRDYLPKEGSGFSIKREVSIGTSVGDVVRELGLPADIPRIIIVNGSHAEESYLFREGDVVSIFPPIAGGGRS